MDRKKKNLVKLGTNVASAKTLFLRIPPELHTALTAAAGEAQQRRGKRVSVNVFATTILAEAMGMKPEA